MDTGSTELWVPNQGCSNRGSLGVRCPNTQVFIEKDSSSAVNTHKPFKIQYGIGDTKGIYMQDHFAVSVCGKFKV
jgi:hypothetical protein